MLDGLYISNFRNFDKEQLVAPLGKINVFIGPNNSGKSNVLRYIRDVLEPLFMQPVYGSTVRAVPSVSAPRFATGHSTERRVLVKVDSATLARMTNRPSIPESWVAWFDNHPLKSLSGYLGLPVDRQNDRLDVVQAQLPERGIDQTITQQIWSAITQRNGGGFSHWHSELMQRLLHESIKPLEVVYIPPYRQIETRLEEFNNEYRMTSDNDHLIDRLSELAHPPYDKQDLRKQFDALVRFVADIIDRPDAWVDIPANRKTINVRTDNAVVPIEALGSGVQEIFYLASEIILNPRSVVLLEEPEVHLHPNLQRKFMRFLNEQVDGQYFISTHSPQVIDTESCKVFGVRSIDGKAEITQLLTSHEKRLMCAELGYKPSDLLQSNCVIWVEGPSDRIYLKHWLSDFDNKLIEGVHFSIMFYGGKLLSHLTLGDAEVTDFIGLLPINRCPVVIMDSDRGAQTQTIRSTKQRVVDELEAVKGLHWVTAGREIENYVDAETRLAAIKRVHAAAAGLAGGANRYAKPLDYLNHSGVRVSSGFDKVAIARAVTTFEINWTVLDLRTRIDAISWFVREANGLQ